MTVGHELELATWSKHAEDLQTGGKSLEIVMPGIASVRSAFTVRTVGLTTDRFGRSISPMP